MTDHQRLVVLLAVLVALAGCPLFKSESTREQELRSAAANVDRQLKTLRATYPYLIKRIEERWRTAKPKLARAKALGETDKRVAAMARALDPVTKPLFALSACERHYSGILDKLGRPSKLGSERRKTIEREARARRSALIAARPSEAQLLEVVHTAETALSESYVVLQDAWKPQ